MKTTTTAQSKFLSWVLRHRPDRIGLELDEQGWADLSELVRQAKAHGTDLSRSDVLALVASGDKQRFALSADGTRIRAQHGHSVAVDLALEPAMPPEMLFHGTARQFLPAIRQQGLLPGRRRSVHLSQTEALAEAVGHRHGTPVVLIVHARALHAEGQFFVQSANGIWLTDRVLPGFLVFPAD